MARYLLGKKSQERLATCDHRLQGLVKAVMETQAIDFAVLCGNRSQEEQDRLYASGRSKVQTSKHNLMPSKAVDIAPYPVRDKTEKDKARYYMLGGLMVATAYSRGIKIRWGGDWNSNGRFDDQTFDDLAHFELVD